MQKIVTIGGGTGHYTLLRGLKNYDVDLTAIVGVVDDSGSSGVLRTEFGILPPGDLRNCLLALADDVKLKDIMDIFDYRFPKSNGTLSNHSLGNLIITALIHKHENIADAVKAASNILNTSGKILPVSIDNTTLYAETVNGKILKGEHEVSYPEKATQIKKIWLDPKANVYKETAEAIRQSNLIVICPGAFYGSILSNFLVKGVKEAIQDSKAKIVYVCNLVTKQGTHGFKVSDYVRRVERAIGKKVDYVICNTKKPTQKIVDKYKEEESFFVEPDLDGDNIIKEDLLIELVIKNLMTARHNIKKVAKLIINLV
jgi:uncharacterized cofD-like protein